MEGKYERRSEFTEKYKPHEDVGGLPFGAQLGFQNKEHKGEQVTTRWLALLGGVQILPPTPANGN